MQISFDGVDTGLSGVGYLYTGPITAGDFLTFAYSGTAGVGATLKVYLAVTLDGDGNPVISGSPDATIDIHSTPIGVYTSSRTLTSADLPYILYSDPAYSGDTNNTIVITAAYGDAPLALTPHLDSGDEGDASFTSVTTGLSVTFTDTSNDSGNIATRAWTFGDSGTATTASPTHAYTAAGLYVVTLTVTWNDGSFAATNSYLQILEPSSIVDTNLAFDYDNWVDSSGGTVTLPGQGTSTYELSQHEYAGVSTIVYGRTVPDGSSLAFDVYCLFADIVDGVSVSVYLSATVDGGGNITLGDADTGCPINLTDSSAQSYAASRALTSSDMPVIVFTPGTSSTLDDLLHLVPTPKPDIPVPTTNIIVDPNSWSNYSSTPDEIYGGAMLGGGQIGPPGTLEYDSSTGTYVLQSFDYNSGDGYTSAIIYNQNTPTTDDYLLFTATAIDNPTQLSVYLSAEISEDGTLTPGAVDFSTTINAGSNITYSSRGLVSSDRPYITFTTTTADSKVVLTPGGVVYSFAPAPSPTPPSPTPPAPTPPTPSPSVNPSVPTYVLKGFLEYDPLANNLPDLTGPYGELSTYSRTYATDTEVFTSSSAAGISFVAFVSATTDPADSLPINGADTGNVSFMVNDSVPSEYITTAMAIGQYVYSNAVANTLPATSTQLTTDLATELGSQITALVIPTYNPTDPTQALPEWIAYKQANDPDQNFVRLWFSDNAFRDQYDQFQIKAVVPFPHLDDFFLSPAVVIAQIATVTPEIISSMVQEVADREPYTIVATYNFGYLNPLHPDSTNPANFTPVPWTVLIYGQAGNNIDSIKQALRDYILGNSTHNESQWAAIFPDLFASTEFIITPMWDQYAVPNETLQTGVYSPIVNDAAAVSIAQQTAIGVGYGGSYVAANVDVVASGYKSMCYLCVGSSYNHVGQQKLIQVFPDYMAVNTTSVDFNRMQQNTQSWIMLMQQLLMVAETMTPFTDVPIGVARIQRGTFLYAVATYQNIDYLVLSKYSLETIVPITPAGAPPSPTPGPSGIPTPVPAEDGSQASFTYSISGLVVTFTDTSTYGAGAHADAWFWGFGDGVGTSMMQNPVYTYPNGGTFVVALKTTDTLGDASMGYNQVVVPGSSPSPSPPSPTPSPPSPTPPSPTPPSPSPPSPPSPSPAPAPVPAEDGTTAGFTFTTTDLQANFTSTSVPGSGTTITSYLWAFGDGSGTAAIANPSYTYAFPGTYLVELLVIDNNSEDASTYQHVVVTAAPPSPTPPSPSPPSPSPSPTPPSPTPPSPSPPSPSPPSPSPSPSPPSPSPSPPSPTPSPPSPSPSPPSPSPSPPSPPSPSPSPGTAADGTTAGFTHSPGGTHTIDFTDTSTPGSGATITGWLWDFGDGFGASTSQNHNYTYASTGLYTVMLRVTDSNSQTASVSHFVSVT